MHPHCLLMYTMVLHVFCVSLLYPHIPCGIGCIMCIPLYSDALWYWMYYVHPHCILMYPMVLYILCASSASHCILLYPVVLHVLCVERGYCISHFGAAHDVCLDSLVPAPGLVHYSYRHTATGPVLSCSVPRLKRRINLVKSNRLYFFPYNSIQKNLKKKKGSYNRLSAARLT